MIEPGSIYTADFRGPRGMLDPTRFRDVIKAIGHVLGSDCEPV